jgi:prepilin-type N-terminal cleavage/methylation domain-containing protein
MKRSPATPTRLGPRSGLTVIELAIVLVLLGIIAVKATLVLTSANETQGQDTSTMSLEDQARRVLDQIAYAVMGADRETMIPEPVSPIPSSELRYRVSIGVEDGDIVWDDQESIGLSAAEDQVVWRQNPELPEEVRVAWCNVVRPFLAGEMLNGDDDNGNGIVDEKGLAFVIDRDAITIRLSLERVGPNGEPITQTVKTTVTVRN